MEISVEKTQDEIQEIVVVQQRYFETGETRPVEFRIKQLKKLREAIKLNTEAILVALRNDLGKPAFEGYATEVGFVLEEIRHTIHHLRDWARPESAATPLTQAISTAKVYHEPYGRVLVIAPWNYPFQLSIAPLVGSISAGNVTLLKPSELAPSTSKLLKKIIDDVFEPQYIKVIEGGIETNQALLKTQHDYIFFTGSTQVGQIVMQAAARHLTPVTLELGGKSPCIVDKNIHYNNTAKRIVWGKFVNTGQTCVAPDYVLIHENVKAKVIEYFIKAIKAFYGEDPKSSPDYGRIINDRHFQRLEGMLNQGSVVHGGQVDAAVRYIAPTLITEPDLNAALMQEEIFGPILPILTYSDLDEAIGFVNSKSRPLALYIFTNNSKVERRVLDRTHSGGGCINDTLVHLSSPELPFGGVGGSGMGAYHGKASFDTFSQKRSILKKSNLIDIPIRYAPYRNKLRLLKWFMR